MAVFDLAQERVCVRVVYDGAASAGKTTNLKQLAEIFASQRTCDLYSPAEVAGRTLYFDWLQIAAGMVAGFPLVCQVVTVPGQLVLTPRRRALLSGADVVVHVVDSGDGAAERALEALRVFDEVAREREAPLPLVLQANKQDQRDAVSGAALLAALGRPPVPVVEAIAADGIGVVDTFVAAVRAAVRAIHARIDAGDVRVPVARAETAGAALASLSAQAVDPEWAVEMMLEEASRAFAEEERAGSAASSEGDAEPPTWRPGHLERRTAPLPKEDVPAGFVWPAHTGREVLRALAADAKLARSAPVDGAGAVRIDAGELVLTTCAELRFESAEAARQALVRAARDRAQLGALLPPETVLVVQPTDEASWLWTILPRATTVAELCGARERGAGRTPVLAAFGASLAEAIVVEARHGLALDLSPRSFGVRHGTVRYLGDVVAAEVARRDAGRALLDAFAALDALGADLEPAIASLESALAATLAPDERAALAGAATWSDEGALAPPLRAAWARIRQALLPSGEAA